MGILWIVIIGFFAGIIARLLSPGPNKPAGFLLTTVLGIIGAFVATFIGQAVGWYRADQGAGFIGHITRRINVRRAGSPCLVLRVGLLVSRSRAMSSFSRILLRRS
jgi:uncharacterized membrane protein YeaQ/YmgE (transglycosylase-associated protein family)